MEKTSQEVSQIVIPYAFVIDIDGTLIKSRTQQIQGASDALNLMTDKKIPYIYLTNNISHSQQCMADHINSILKLKAPAKQEQVILNYTPLREEFEWKDKTILLIGRLQRLNSVLPLDFLKKYVTVEEYCTMFPETVPLCQGQYSQEQSQKVKREINQRLFSKDSNDLNKEDLKLDAVLILITPNRWEQSFQVIIDIFNSPEATQKGKYALNPQNRIPVVTVVNDMFFQSISHKLPRLMMKPFIESLRQIFHSVYGEELEIKIYGKPSSLTHKYAEKHLMKYCRRSIFGEEAHLVNKELKIEKIVMIGDNADSDILGAHLHGWDSIMVKTGPVKEDAELATINSNHILEGVQKYMELNKGL